MNTARLSIIVPTLNEAQQILPTLKALAPLRTRGAEVVVVDGSSDDGTAELAAAWADRVIQSPIGRAQQMNAGAAISQGSIFLFLHADTCLPLDADRLIQHALTNSAQWGRFDVHLAGQHFMLPVVAFFMNWRSRLSGIATGDQAIFVRASTFAGVGGIPLQPLMEDIELSRRLKALSSPSCLRARVTTSGRRWESRGVWRTIFLMWSLRLRYWRGESPWQLAKAYR